MPGYANLELLVNEKFVLYITMVKILATLKNLYAKAYLSSDTKLKPATERVRHPNLLLT